MTVHFDYSQTVTNLDLLAADGSLTWTVTGVTTPISLSATTGSIPADGHATVQVKLDRSLLVQLAGKATVVFHDSEQHTCQIQISWDFSLL